MDRCSAVRALALASLAVGGVLLTGAQRAHAQEVNGIWTDTTTKDLGRVTHVGFFNHVRIRGWAEGYSDWNFNRVAAATATANQDASVIKASDITVEGRAFDVHRDTPKLNLGEVEIERVPEHAGPAFKLDLAAGETQDIIQHSILATSPNSLPGWSRYIQHASIGYLVPVGTGLRIDVGKFVTHIGGETIESIKNRNFSHSYFYSYGIPFQDAGIRVNYAWSSNLYNEVYVLKGWNVMTDNNSAKTIGLTTGFTPSAAIAVYANYLGGPERNDNSHDWRHLGDAQIVVSLTPTLQSMLNIDVAADKHALADGSDAHWGGAALYLRQNIRGHFFPTVRVEYYDDPHGYTTGVAQHVWSYTFTGDYKVVLPGSFSNVLVRPELRYDKSSALFFSSSDAFRSRDHQLTFGVGMVAYF